MSSSLYYRMSSKPAQTTLQDPAPTGKREKEKSLMFFFNLVCLSFFIRRYDAGICRNVFIGEFCSKYDPGDLSKDNTVLLGGLAVPGLRGKGSTSFTASDV